MSPDNPMLKKWFVLIAVVIAISGLLYLTDIDDRLHHQVVNPSANAAPGNDDIGLNRYQLVTPVHRVDGIHDNLSGLTFCPSSSTLFAIANNPCRIYELNTEGVLLRTIELPGFQDTEGIVYVRDDLFAIIEERRHTLNLLKITASTTVVNQQQLLSSIAVDSKGADNFGFEGVAYDPNEAVFFIANEKEQRQIIKVTGWPAGAPLQIQTDTGVIHKNLHMSDFSGLHFDLNSGHLLFLSDESKRVVEVTMQGEQISSMELESGFSGIDNDIPQPEGIAMDRSATLYIVSEPNLFYRFKPEPVNGVKK
jgi:uncharacterized protein YjiK